MIRLMTVATLPNAMFVMVCDDEDAIGEAMRSGKILNLDCEKNHKDGDLSYICYIYGRYHFWQSFS